MGVVIREKVKKSGVWWVFIAHKGRRSSKRIGSKSSARRVAREIEIKLASGTLIPAHKKSPTVEEQFRVFKRNYLDTAVRPSTKSSYESNFRAHVIPALGGRRLDQLSRVNVKDFVALLVRKNLAKPTIRIITAQLCAMLNQAKEDGLIRKNHATGLSKFYKNAPTRRTEIETLTRAEVAVFLRKAKEWCSQWYPLFLCALHTGLRTGELVGLQWGDIDFFNKWIVVRRSVVRRKLQGTKTSKIRRVDISDALMEVLRDLKRRRKQEWLAKANNEIPEWVFCADNGNFMDPYNLKTRYFYRCLEKAGLRRIRFHDLRHTYATLMLEQGHPIAHIQQQLGHSSIKMTVDVYGHLVPGSNRDAVNSLPSLDAEETVTAAQR